MRNRYYRTLLLLALAAIVPACGGGGGGGGGAASTPVLLASATALGVPGNGNSDSPVMSSNGQFVAFRSDAGNLVAGDTTQGDIFRKDMTTGTVLRISRTAGGTEPNAASSSPAMSSDGRFIAYVSTASDIIVSAGITGTRSNVYLYDAATGITTLVSHSTAALTTEATGNSASPSITSFGGVPTVQVAFESNAQDIITGFGGYMGANIFRKTAGTAAIDLVSRDFAAPTTTVGNLDSSLPSISADGNLIAFQSLATNLIAAGTDLNVFFDIFVRNMTSGVTERVSLNDADLEVTGASFNPMISADGAHVVFMSQGTNLGDTGLIPNDIYIRSNWATLATKATTQMSEHPGDVGTGENCNTPAISSDGNLIVWPSGSSVLVNGDNNLHRDIFQRNRTANTLDRVSLTSAGAEVTGGSALTASISRPAISTGGTFIAFDSNATTFINPVTTSRHIWRRG